MTGDGRLAGHAPQVPVDADAIRMGDRRALSRAITRVESTRADHRAEAQRLIADLLPHTGKSVRLGITGVPGVGKSTFIEALGLRLIEQGHRVAVLAVDPSSKRSGGSILADKTRMEALSRAAEAFIRPSPAGATLGGVARRTRESMLLCEAAGFDVVIVETVGVGQSVTAVADMVDMLVLLLAPAGGDEIQGLKKGVVEMADLLVVNKADGDLAAAAGRAAADYRHAIELLTPATPAWTPRVLQCSAKQGRGIGEVWDAVRDYRGVLEPAGIIAARRAEQAKAWMWSEIEDRLIGALRADAEVAALLPALEAAVAAGETPPASAAAKVLAAFRGVPDA